MLNSVVLRGDVSARPCHASDFKEPGEVADVLRNIASLGRFRMNHVRLLTLKWFAAKHQLLKKGEL